MSEAKMRIVVVAACAALLAGCNTSYNYFEDDVAETEERPMGAFGMLLGATGIVDTDPPQIEYKPRAPLAMPPGRDLPPPESRTAAAADVAWPTDPEEVRAERRRASAEAGADQMRYENSVRDSDVARASPETMQAGRLEGGGTRERETTIVDELADPGRRSSPLELARQFFAREEDGGIITAEGSARPRQYLVEPPDEYRTPSADAPLPDAREVEHSEWGKAQLYGGATDLPTARAQPSR